MKKLFFAVVITAVTMTSINAQKFGAKVGLNLANITGDNTDGNKMQIGAHIGGFAEFEITEQFAFQPEILFSMQGYKNESNTETNIGGIVSKSNIELSAKMNYINIPLMFKYYVTEGISLELGPQIGFLISAKADSSVKTKITDGTTVLSEINSEANGTDVKDNIKSLDYGLNIGVGYKMENGLLFGARYNLGLANLNDLEGTDFSNKNSVISISVGYFFN